MSSFWNAPAWSIPKRCQSANNLKNKTTVPGPGNYQSNGKIGNPNPGWKIGTANRNKQYGNNFPGPGQYQSSLKKTGPKVSIGIKPKNGMDDQNVPGPGNYNVNDNSIMKSYSGYTMGAKYSNNKIQDPQPGPGAYNLNESKRLGVKIGTSKRNPSKQKQLVPGVGSYQVGYRPLSAGPNYSIGSGLKSSNNKRQFNPGPGQYDTNSFLQQKKGITIGQKISKNYQTLSNIPGPGQYQESFKRPMSGAKIGRAQRSLMSATLGPGPGAYDCNYISKKTSAKIGSGKRYNMEKNDTPGPGSYEGLIKYKGGISISGIKNKKNIQITPGPGAYDTTGDGFNKRPCSAKIGLGTRSKFDHSDTPGPGSYNIHSQQNWKFAYSKQNRSKDLSKNQPGPGQYDIPSSVPSAPYYELYECGASKLGKSGVSRA